jgi:hypothetical protein
VYFSDEPALPETVPNHCVECLSRRMRSLSGVSRPWRKLVTADTSKSVERSINGKWEFLNLMLMREKIERAYASGRPGWRERERERASQQGD